MRISNKKIRRLQESQGDVIFEPPEGMDMLTESYTFEVLPGSLVEEELPGGGKRAYLEGRLGLVGKATANRRLYTRKLMERELAKKFSDMKAKKIYGELDHPGDGKTKFSRVSHFVLGAKINEQDEIIGKLEFIPGTPNGDIALNIARAGGVLGVSSRGFGSVVPNAKGDLIVQEDYQLVTWDIVPDPANAGAHPNFVVEEKEMMNMNPEQLKKFMEEHPEAVEAIKAMLAEDVKDEVRKELEPEAREHAREALRSELEGQLQEEGESIRKEAVEQARREAADDPEVAGAKRVVEELKELVGPFVLGEDGDKVVSELRTKIEKLEKTIADQDETISEQEQQMESIAAVAKELGFKLYLERALGEDADAVSEQLGDVSEYASINDLKEAVAAILEGMEADEERNSEYEEEIAKREAEIAKLRKTNEDLKEQREQALGIGAKMGVRAYLEQRIAGHPRAIKIRKYVKESDPTTKEQVDRLIEAYDADNPVSDDYLHLRRGLSRTRMTEDFSSPNPGGSRGMGDVMGVSMKSLTERTERIS